MEGSANVDHEASIFLQKLMEDGTGDPTKLASRLFVMCQHMKMKNKDQTFAYRVIYRAMEIVLQQHGIDQNAFFSSGLFATGETFWRGFAPQSSNRTFSGGIDGERANSEDMRSGGSASGHSGPFAEQGSSKQPSTEDGLEESRAPSSLSSGPGRQATTQARRNAGSSEAHARNMTTAVAGVPTRMAKQSRAKGADASNPKGTTNMEQAAAQIQNREQDSSKAVQTQANTNVAATGKRKGKRKKEEMDSSLPQVPLPQQASQHASTKVVNRAEAAKRSKTKSSGVKEAIVGDEYPANKSNSVDNKLETPLRSSTPPTAAPSPHSYQQPYSADGKQLDTSVMSGSTSNIDSHPPNYMFRAPIVQPIKPGSAEAMPSMGAMSADTHSHPFKAGIRAVGPYNVHNARQPPQQNQWSNAQELGYDSMRMGFGVQKMGSPDMSMTGSAFDCNNSEKLDPASHATSLPFQGDSGWKQSQGGAMTSERAPRLARDGRSYMGMHVANNQVTQTANLDSSVQDSGSFQKDSVLERAASVDASNLIKMNYGAAFATGTEVTSGIESSNMKFIATGNPFHQQLMSKPDSNRGPQFPFSDHQLKQLRAQCLVFLSLRNKSQPKRLHLALALENQDRRLEKLAGDVTVSTNLSTSMNKPGDQKHHMPESDAGCISANANCNLKQENAQWMTSQPSSQGRQDDARGLLSDVQNREHERNGLGHAEGVVYAEQNNSGFMAGKGYNHAFTKSSIVNENATPLQSATGPFPVDYKDGSSVNSFEQNNSGCTPSVHKGLVASVQTNFSMNQGSSNSASSQPLCPAVKDRGSTEMYQLEKDGVCGTTSKQLILTQKSEEGERGFASAMIDPVSMTVQATPSAGLPVSTAAAVATLGTVALPEKKLAEVSAEMECPVSNAATEDINEEQGGERENVDEGEDRPVLTEAQLPRKLEYTTIEKWTLDQKKRKQLEEQSWAAKQLKTEERITVRFHQLKEAVSSSEDISVRTKSVIELKKLELLQLQRRLRRDFLHDFFKPITADIDMLRSMKKVRPGRRMKQLERIELRQKEERLRRSQNRQKEFFREVETHKEKVEDWSKLKRERWRSINRYVREFHKKKERIHREKLDRIQREKIILLKNNDVEGYLRMVKDAKSDRVKQLLKETEGYIQTLSVKLQQQKMQARADNELSMDIETVEDTTSNDQAQHYLESNEKYYLMAHSVKEVIDEQPHLLIGGKLREYQLNGLRWMVSLYNNNLNGILADEMGLGKTVQVIALLSYLIGYKNDRGPFLVVVPSSVLPNWISELNHWAPSIGKVAYTGPPEERRRLFKEKIAQQQFNVLLTTYEYLMNKHDRSKLCKISWHYVIIDEGHRIKNASCKLNAELKNYQSAHRLLLTGTPLQNKLEELWALLNFLLPSIFNSSEDFAQWFNKPFETVADTATDQALLSEEENLLIINRLHQVLRPFVLRRLKQKVENELPEKFERLVRCKPSAYQVLLMNRVKEKLGSLGHAKGRAVHNTVIELRNICNHPYLSHLHTQEAERMLPSHYLPSIVRLCGKLETLDRILPKLKACNHRILLFSTMTRLLDVLEDYLQWKSYRYLRLDGHTNGTERGALIDLFNSPDSEAFLFLLSIRAGGVGINLQAADTVILFDTDWNPQVDLQAQARAHRIGQKRHVLVLRLETVHSVEEQVRAAAEHKLGVANQSITAGFFDNNTSAEDRKEYLEGLLRESKKEEDAPVLDDDALNYLLARSDDEIDIFEAVDKQRIEEEQMLWKKHIEGKPSEEQLSVPPRLLQENELISFLAAIQSMESERSSEKQKPGLGAVLNTEQYGRGKRAREVKSYGDQLSEKEFEELCQVEESEPVKKRDPDRGKSTREIQMQPADATTVDAMPTQPPVAKKRGRPRKNAPTIGTPSSKSHTLIDASAAKRLQHMSAICLVPDNSEASKQRTASNELRSIGSDPAGNQILIEISETHQEASVGNLKSLHHGVHMEPVGAFQNKVIYHGAHTEPLGAFDNKAIYHGVHTEPVGAFQNKAVHHGLHMGPVATVENKAVELHINPVSAIAVEAPSAAPEMRSSSLLREKESVATAETVSGKRVEDTEPVNKQDAAICLTTTGDCEIGQPSEQPSTGSQPIQQQGVASFVQLADSSDTNVSNLEHQDVQCLDLPKQEERISCEKGGSPTENSCTGTETQDLSAQHVNDGDDNPVGLTSQQIGHESRVHTSKQSETLDAGYVAPMPLMQSGSVKVDDKTPPPSVPMPTVQSGLVNDDDKTTPPMPTVQSGPVNDDDKTTPPMPSVQSGPVNDDHKTTPSSAPMSSLQSGPVNVDDKTAPPSLT